VTTISVAPTQLGVSPPPLARAVVLVVLVLTAALAGALFATSMLQAQTLVGRFMTAAGDVRTGSVTQSLIAELPQRLRLAGASLLALVLGLLALRTSFEQVVTECLVAIRGRAMPVLRPGADAIAIMLLIVLAAGLRLPFTGQPMRYDEALSFNEFASRPLYYGLSFYPEPNNHLLNTLLMHLAYVTLGNQPWVLRLPALLAGVLLVPATYVLGRQLFGRGAGLIAAVLVTTASYLVEYSTNARGYTLEALCFVLTFSLLVFAARSNSVPALVVAVMCAALGLYAVPTMVYGLAVIAVWWGLYRSRVRVRAIAVVVLLLALLATLAYLPVVIISGPQALLANRFVVPLSIDELARELPTSLIRTWQLWNRDLPLPAIILLAIGCAVSAFAQTLRRQVPLAVMAPAVCVVLVLIQRVAPFERVWLFLLPLYFIVAAAGLARLLGGRSPSRTAEAVALLVFSLGLAAVTANSGSVLASTETGVFPDAEAVAITLRGQLGPRDAVVTRLPASLPELQYYFPRAGLGTDSLVRDPAGADRVYVISAPGAAPPRGQEIQHYGSATLYRVEPD
jgi:hypothetical protein